MLFLHNPASRAGSVIAQAGVDALRRLGAAVRPVEFSAAVTASDQILRHAGAIDAIVICGGDGSINAAARGLVETQLPFGIVAAGTGNDLARTLDIPTDPALAAEVVCRGRTCRIDLGEVNGRYFFNVASIGLSVELARALTPGLKSRFGKLGYALAAAQVLLRARRFRAVIETERDRYEVQSYQIAVGNGRHYGGGVVVESSAAIDDSRLDLYSVEAQSLWRLPLLLPSFLQGTHGRWSEVRTASGRQFCITTRRPMAINADGELLSRTPAVFRVHGGAVTAFVP